MATSGSSTMNSEETLEALRAQRGVQLMQRSRRHPAPTTWIPILSFSTAEPSVSTVLRSRQSKRVTFGAFLPNSARLRTQRAPCQPGPSLLFLQSLISSRLPTRTLKTSKTLLKCRHCTSKLLEVSGQRGRRTTPLNSENMWSDSLLSVSLFPYWF